MSDATQIYLVSVGAPDHGSVTTTVKPKVGETVVLKLELKPAPSASAPLVSPAADTLPDQQPSQTLEHTGRRDSQPRRRRPPKRRARRSDHTLSESHSARPDAQGLLLGARRPASPATRLSRSDRGSGRAAEARREQPTCRIDSLRRRAGLRRQEDHQERPAHTRDPRLSRERPCLSVQPWSRGPLSR